MGLRIVLPGAAQYMIKFNVEKENYELSYNVLESNQLPVYIL